MLILIISTFLCFVKFAAAIQCSIPNGSKTRIFNSLEAFQGNRVPFSPIFPEWEGSIVEFNCTLEILQKNDFIAHDSLAIITLRLTSKKIKRISEGAFNSLFCLHDLFLNRNNITCLEQGCFSDLERLHMLDLSKNSLANLSDLSFSNLRRLKFLNLANNKLKNIQQLTFHSLTYLVTLNLEFNHLTRIVHNVFNPVTNLRKLDLSYNRLGEIDFQKLNGLGNLTDLNLAGNFLKRLDTDFDFSFSGLIRLNVNCNHLSQFNVDGLVRHFPRLELIDLNENAWICEDLTTILHKLEVSKINVVRGMTTGNSGKGINCSDGPPTAIQSTPLSSESSTITKHDEGLPDIFNKLTNLVVGSICLLVLVVVYEIFTKTDIFKKCRRGTSLQTEGDNTENIRLLHF